MILNRGKSNKDGGYVLIDVLVTLLIISIVMTSLLGGYALIGNIVGGSWKRIVEIINNRNEFEKIQRIP
jgi:hypothetical protein